MKATAIDLKQGYGFLSFETEQDAEDCYAERFDAKIGVFLKKWKDPTMKLLRQMKSLKFTNFLKTPFHGR